MNTKLLSGKALSVIDQYQNFVIGNSKCSIPYFNNKHQKLGASLRVQVGKGSPKDIFDELKGIAVLEKINMENLDGATFKKVLIDHSIGIDCSGLAFYILNEESISKNKGGLDKHIHFTHAENVFRKIRAKMNPEKNTNVETLADDKNSRIMPLKDSEPGDMITMIGGPEDREQNHVLIIHQIEYQNFIPTTLHYTHAMAWPTDGEYGHGIRQGEIQITDPAKSILEQKWIEAGKTGADNYTFTRARKSRTEIRRLNWL